MDSWLCDEEAYMAELLTLLQQLNDQMLCRFAYLMAGQSTW